MEAKAIMNEDVGKKLEDWVETCYSLAENIVVKDRDGRVLYRGRLMFLDKKIANMVILDGVYFVDGQGYECIVV